MLNRFQGWRERGWTSIDAADYQRAWDRYGGSVATHPLVVERLAGLAQIPVRYLGWEQDGRSRLQSLRGVVRWPCPRTC